MDKYPLLQELANVGTNSKLRFLFDPNYFTIIAGPCAVESESQIMKAAEGVKKFGADILRGSAYKPRTSPMTFQGLGYDGLKLLRKAGDEFDIPVITEVIDTRDVPLAAEFADILQVGTRSMFNYPLLTEIAKTGKPVLLKRGWSASLDEWLHAAEYIAFAGNHSIILCERGIRTFETSSRNTLDLNSVVIAKQLCRLPVFSDPSHGTGVKSMVAKMALASVMAGCNGVEIETHPNPESALSDSTQQLTLEEFARLAHDLRATVEFRKSLENFSM